MQKNILSKLKDKNDVDYVLNYILEFMNYKGLYPR